MIPIEMTHYPSWVVWRYEERNGKPTKVPYSPRTARMADVTDPSTWGRYDEAMDAGSVYPGLFNGIGFVLSEHDPYCIIDLDNPGDDIGAVERAKQVLETFQDTYSEVSPSGAGIHIILKGSIPQGRRTGKIEMYSSVRYITMTGNTYNGKPIVERDYFVQRLYEQLGSNRHTINIAEVEDTPQRFSDEQIYMKACETNDKFLALWQGNYSAWYASQSEADFALINILSFYSRNKDQIARMFHYSELGKRPKAHRQKYLQGMIARSFDNMPPDISLDQLMGNLQKQLEDDRARKQKNPSPMLGEGWSLPPGLMGEIAQFIYSAAPRPVQEIALAGAIGLMAGICGRAYNVSSTGLNQYILLMATTGRGKEAAKSGISKLMARICARVPNAKDFIGPADIASGQALIKYLGDNPCFVSILGEFGIALQQMCEPHTSPALKQLRRVILDLFGKSGKSDTVNPTIYSDKSNNTSIVNSPSFSLLGETTPDSFFPHLSEDIIAQGLLPRFTCIEYTGKRVALNHNHASQEPSQHLVQTLETLCANVLALAHNRQTIDVTEGEDATDFIHNFDVECDTRVNTSESEVARQMWTRAHLKMMKLAALIAVGVDMYQPIITLKIAQWATHLVEKDIANILDRFEQGRVGRDSNEQNQIRRMKEICKDFVYRPVDASMQKYGVSENMHRDRVVQYSYLMKRLIGQPAFKDDRMGSSFAMRRTIDALISEGIVVELTANQIHQRYKYTGKAYFITDLEKLG